MKPLNFSPFPILESERLQLRRVEHTDVNEVFFLRSNPDVLKYIKREPAKKLIEATKFINKIQKGMIEKKWITWAITTKELHNMIGSICIWNFSEKHNSGEVGYDLMPNFQGQGYMTEALQSVIQYGFKTLELDTLEAFTDRRNQPSIHLLLKNHFRHDTSRIDNGNDYNRIYVLKNDGLI